MKAFEIQMRTYPIGKPGGDEFDYIVAAETEHEALEAIKAHLPNGYQPTAIKPAKDEDMRRHRLQPGQVEVLP